MSRMFEKKNTYPVILGNLNSGCIVKSAYVNICQFKRENGTIFFKQKRIPDVFNDPYIWFNNQEYRI